MVKASYTTTTTTLPHVHHPPHVHALKLLHSLVRISLPRIPDFTVHPLKMVSSDMPVADVALVGNSVYSRKIYAY